MSGLGAATDEEVMAAFRETLGAEVVRIVERGPYEYATSHPLEELVVEVDDSVLLRVILKDLSHRRLLAEASHAKPRFLYEPRRAIDAHRVLAAELLGPRCYAAVVDPARDRYWFAMEKVPGVELWQVGEMAVWEEVARWLARFHARFSTRVEEVWAGNPHLLEYGPAAYRFWALRARRAVESSGDPRSRSLVRMLRGYDRVVDALLELPSTFLHGEFFPSNILVTNRPGDWRVCPVDWEMAAVGPGALDLAALCSGWHDDERAQLVSAYHDAAQTAGTASGGWRDLALEVDRLTLHLALQWLGWADEWQAPPQHAHDWLGEAIDVAERLGL